MRRSLPALFCLLLSILLVQHVRALFPRIDDPVPELAPEPNEPASGPASEPASKPEQFTDGNHGDDSPLPSGGLDGSEGHEAESEEEDYSEILEHVYDLIDAIIAIADPGDGSPTTVPAPLPTAVLPCYSVSSSYDECRLHTSEFPHLAFPIQASCLCYATKGNDTTATWAPSSYDGLMSRCNSFAQTQKLVSTITKVGNSSSDFSLCASAGDVRATPTLATASSTSTRSATPASATTAANTPIPTFTGGSGDRMYGLRPLVACLGLWLCKMAL